MINDLLKKLIEKEGSDLHLKVGNKPIIRVSGELVRIEEEPVLSPQSMIEFVKEMVTNKKRQQDRRKSIIKKRYITSWNI